MKTAGKRRESDKGLRFTFQKCTTVTQLVSNHKEATRRDKTILMPVLADCYGSKSLGPMKIPTPKIEERLRDTNGEEVAERQ